MKNILYILSATALVGLNSCNNKNDQAFAYGNFEAVETTISAQMPGEIKALNITEGQVLKAQEVVGYIDTLELHFLKLEILANRKSISAQAENIITQIEVLQNELKNLKREQKRVKNLIEAGAATTRQLDDIEGKISVTQSKIRSIKSQNANVLGQVESVDAKLKQLENRISKSIIVSPIDGTVLSKLAEPFELGAPGKPLFKMANLQRLELKVYVSGSQLHKIKVGESYTVKIDGNGGDFIELKGKLTWVSSESEFTPKTIQTQEERVNLVYAAKILVENNGNLKIGMPGELWVSEVE